MPKICYVEKRFNSSTKPIIAKSIEILEEYARDGIAITLRTLYYRLVALNIIANKQTEYDRLSYIISDARLAGLIDWNYLIDRTRHLNDLEHFADGKDALKRLAAWYHIDFWANQEYRPEVWVEKDTAIGTVDRICQSFDVPYFSCRGFTSQSEMWRAGCRLARHVEGGQIPIILHFGDHDPSGKDMTRDVMKRLEMYMGGVELERLALNMDQIHKYAPPPNPVKLTDSRSAGYIASYGRESWELEALDPKVIVDLIDAKLRELIDWDTWNADIKRKETTKKRLEALAKRWKNK